MVDRVFSDVVDGVETGLLFAVAADRPTGKACVGQSGTRPCPTEEINRWTVALVVVVVVAVVVAVVVTDAIANAGERGPLRFRTDVVGDVAAVFAFTIILFSWIFDILQKN